MKISLIQSIFVMQRLKNSTNSEERRGTSLLHSIFILHLRRAILVIDSVFVTGKNQIRMIQIQIYNTSYMHQK